MSRHLHILFLWMPIVALASPLSAQSPPPRDTSTQYLRLQEAYSQRMQDIEQQYGKASRELLNKFILALVRTEQNFRDEGNLEGVVTSRALREQLLTTSEYPEMKDAYPDKIKSMLQTLFHHREQARQKHQAELDTLNQLLLNALEPYQIAFTKSGDIETAKEILAIRTRLKAARSGETVAEETHGQPSPGTTTSQDPNTYGFCLEPSSFASIPRLTAREPAIPFEPKIEGEVEVTPRGFEFSSGQLRIEAGSMAAFLQRVRNNQMITVEFGVQSYRHSQGDEIAPAPILVYGKHLQECNLAIIQEGTEVFLLLRTTTPPADSPLHRINLGQLEVGRAQHIMITYRSGALTVYRDGREVTQLRDEITGLLSNWQAYPVLMGATDALDVPQPAPALPETDPQVWSGFIHQFYMKSSFETSRNASNNYKRFSTAISH